MDDVTSGHDTSSDKSNTDYAVWPGNPTADDHSLFPPASVLLLSFHRGGAFDGVNLTPTTPQDELLLLTAALASHHRSLAAARERLRDSALLERERLDAALLMDLKQCELAVVIARIDTWVGQVSLPEQDGEVVDQALPLGFSFGDLFSVMAEVEISLDPTFRHEPECRRLVGQEFRFEELCWAYQGAVADLLEGRRYPPTARRRNELVSGAGTPAGVPAAEGEGAKERYHESELPTRNLVHLRVAATDFQLDYVATRREAELFAEELADSTLNATVTVDDEVHAGMLPLPFWDVPPHEG